MTNPVTNCNYLYDTQAAEFYIVLRAHIHNVTGDRWGKRTSQSVTIVEWGDKGMVGAACGVVYPGWFSLDLIWVEEGYRGQGVGDILLDKVEKEAVRLGAHSVYVWTQDFEAPDFYVKHGYTEFVELKEFLKGHQLIGLRKRLTPEAPQF